MPKRPGGLTILDGFEQRRTVSTALAEVTNMATYNSRTGLFQIEEFIFVNQTLTVIDSGGASGGWVTHEMGKMPVTMWSLLAGIIRVEVLSVGGGISATGDVQFGVGSTLANQGDLLGSKTEFTSRAVVTLVGGAGSAHTTYAPPGPITRDGATSSGDNFQFNIGVLDADISATADITFNAFARFFWVDLGPAVVF